MDREVTPELHPYYYPPVPQYRQIKKPSRFQRICCPCRHRRRRSRSFHDPYQPFVVPEEYLNRLDHLKQNGTVPVNLCHRHSIHHPVEQQTQTDLSPRQLSIDETNDEPFLGRRRSSVRFEDELPLVKVPDKPPTSPKIESIPVIKKEEETIIPVPTTDLEQHVSFLNNEDDLWTTITINTEQSVPVQSSHFNRLSLENLSCVATSKPNSDNGITAIHVNSKPSESETTEKEISPPVQPSSKTTRHRSASNRHKPPPPPPSRCHTTSSEDDADLRNIKPLEEINAIVADKYNYNELSQALKSNVNRLKNTFIHSQKNESIYDKPKTIRSTSSEQSLQKSNINNHSSDC